MTTLEGNLQDHILLNVEGENELGLEDPLKEGVDDGHGEGVQEVCNPKQSSECLTLLEDRCNPEDAGNPHGKYDEEEVGAEVWDEEDAIGGVEKGENASCQQDAGDEECAGGLETVYARDPRTYEQEHLGIKDQLGRGVDEVKAIEVEVGVRPNSPDRGKQEDVLLHSPPADISREVFSELGDYSHED